jgi:leader peptidase (prepilin peptidase)/N-methyltransferase
MTHTVRAIDRPNIPVVFASAVGSIAIGVATLGLGGSGWRSAFNAVWALPVIAAAVEDAYTARLRDVIVLRGLGAVLLAGLLVAIADRDGHVMTSLVTGALLMSGWMMIIHLVSPHGLGFGDVKFGLLLGCGVGLATPVGAVIVFAVAAIVQGLVMVGRWLPAQRLGVTGPRSAPFGPALAVASILFVVVVTGLRGGRS